MSNALRRFVTLPLSRRAVAPAALALLTAPAAFANDIADELDFARGLAADWQFIDIAESILDDVSTGELDSDERALLELTRCDVFGEGARWAQDPTSREQLFERALDGYRGFIDANGRSEYVDQAAASYVDLGAAYIAAMESALEDAAGEDAARIRTNLEDQIESLLQYSGQQVNRLSGFTNAIEKQEYGRQLLYRAQIALAAFRLISDDELYFIQIEQAVEEITVQFGDLSGYGLSAYVVLGDAYLAAGETYDAPTFYEFVIEQTVPTDVEAWTAWLEETNPSSERLDGLWYFVELAQAKWINALEAAGDSEGAMRAALYFHNTWRREGFNLSARGHLGLLAAARVFLDSNGFLAGNPDAYAFFSTFDEAREAGIPARRIVPTAEVALELASFTNEENQGNTLQLRAQRLIADAIDRPGVQVGIETLFEAAKGYYNARDYAAAVDALREVRGSITDAADAQLYTPRILFHIGRSYYFQKRYLEAAMAYREAITEWQGDAEYDEQNAEGFYNSIRQLRQEIKDDPRIEQLYRESETLMTSLGADPGTITYRAGVREFDAGNFEAARPLFQSVERSAPVYEKALVKSARCAYELGDLATAVSEFDAYLDDYVNDPTNRIGATDATLRQVRDEAQAEASFYKGQVYWNQQNYDAMVALYQQFPETYGNQPDLVAAALYYCVNASLEQDDVSRAKSFHDKLLADHETNDFTGNGATLIYNAVTDRFGVAEQSGDTETARQMLADRARYAEVSNDLRAEPDFMALLAEARLWRDLEDWAKAEEDFATLMRLFGDDDDSRQQKLLTQSVRPDMAEALLQLGRVPEAFESVATFVPDPEDKESRPTEQTVQVYCRSVAGWVTGDPSNPTLVAGVGGAENFAKAGPWWRKLSNSHEKWLDCEWYWCEFNRAWTYYQWGKLDSAKTQVARDIVRVIGADTANFELVAENCGGDRELRDRFRWLAKQL